MIRAGSLTGRVLLSENVGVRQLVFAGGGAVDDLGRTGGFGSGLEAIVGAIGVQP